MSHRTNWLLINEIRGDVLVLMFYQLGSHSELLKKTPIGVCRNRTPCYMEIFYDGMIMTFKDIQ